MFDCIEYNPKLNACRWFCHVNQRKLAVAWSGWSDIYDKGDIIRQGKTIGEPRHMKIGNVF